MTAHEEGVISTYALGMVMTAHGVLYGISRFVNGWTQGMGFPPCAKMLAHWIHPKELATKMSIWNSSHSIGAFLALGVCSLLFALGFGWRWCFYVPAALAGLGAVFCFFCVKDSPAEAGVHEVEYPRKAVSPRDAAYRKRDYDILCLHGG